MRIPCSLLFAVSRMGFSNMHSIPAWRHRLQGGLSASVHFIFCLRHALQALGTRLSGLWAF